MADSSAIEAFIISIIIIIIIIITYATKTWEGLARYVGGGARSQSPCRWDEILRGGKYKGDAEIQ